jgi:small subunit ribosomal protein S8
MVNHTVSDLITRIKNAALAKRKEIFVPYSRISKEIAKVLAREGFLGDVSEEKVEDRRMLKITIKYNNRLPIITGAKVLSKPSARMYSGFSKLVQNQRKGMYTIILSTSKGIMTGDEAQKKKIGGEALFRIW